MATIDNDGVLKFTEEDVKAISEDRGIYPIVRKAAGEFVKRNKKPFESPKSGSWWLVAGEKYMLSVVDDYVVALISQRGNRWASPVRVDNYLRITKEEWEKITAGFEATSIEKPWLCG